MAGHPYPTLRATSLSLQGALCLPRRATWPREVFSTRRHMLEPVRPEAVLPNRALCLPTLSHLLIVNKTSHTHTHTHTHTPPWLSFKFLISCPELELGRRLCPRALLSPGGRPNSVKTGAAANCWQARASWWQGWRRDSSLCVLLETLQPSTPPARVSAWREQCFLLMQANGPATRASRTSLSSPSSSTSDARTNCAALTSGMLR